MTNGLGTHVIRAVDAKRRLNKKKKTRAGTGKKIHRGEVAKSKEVGGQVKR